MSEKRCHSGCMDGERTTQIQQHLASCSSEELLDGLSELVLGDDDSDETMDMIDAYLSELDARSPCDTNISAEESLRNFHEKYDHLFEVECQEDNEIRPPKPRRIRRYVLLAATLGILVCMFAVQAMGVNWVEALVQWTGETFGFIFDDGTHESVKESGENPFENLQMLLLECNITGVRLPTFLPEGYESCELSAGENLETISAGYECENSYICIQIRKTNSSSGARIEKDGLTPIVYSSNGMQFYVFTNAEEYMAAWTSGEYECLLFGVPTEDLLYEILDSMEIG